MSDNEAPLSPNSDSDNDSSTSDDGLQDSRRSVIRKNMWDASFEDLIKLREKIGSKAFFGVVSRKSVEQVHKRANKNRPREISSKLRGRKLRKELGVDMGKVEVKKQETRDPRFDSMCGEFDQKTFQRNYKFVDKIRLKEKKILEKQLKEEKDPEKKNQIRMLVQRLDNKLRSKEEKDKEDRKKLEEKREVKEMLKRGEKPKFKKKSVKKLENLIEKYENLKKTDRLKKHMERRSKKLAAKERKRNVI